MKFAYLHHRKGFSIAEVIIALGILTVAGVGMWLLAAQSLRSVHIARQNLIAANLAQEGVELVRNIRDSNWHRTQPGSRDDDDGSNCASALPRSWRDGICDGSWRATYSENKLLPIMGANPRLKVDTNGLYQYDDGSLSLFRRRIKIITHDDLATPVREDLVSMRIQSIVEWGERKLVVEDELWNWSGE